MNLNLLVNALPDIYVLQEAEVCFNCFVLFFWDNVRI
jgi:hypothetical protein